MPNNQKIVLFQGDSITDGGRPRETDGGPPLETEGFGTSYPFLIAARVSADLASEAPVFLNRGISGNRVSDMSARWNEDTYYLKPDLLSILIGVNDAWVMARGVPKGTTDRFERFYRSLLEETKEVLPHTQLVLLEPFVLKTGKTVEGWSTWESLLPQYQQIIRQLSADFNTLFVPLQEVFNDACKRADASFWLYDGVHPTPAGHALIADQWLKVVKPNCDLLGK